METDTENTTSSSKEASYYTLTEAMTKLQVSKPTIYKWAKNGKLNCITMPSGHKRYDVDDYIKNPNKPLPVVAYITLEEEKQQLATVNTFIVENEQTGQLSFKSDLTSSKELRVFGTCEEPLFVAKDVAEMLGYNDTDQAIRENVIKDDKLTYSQYMVNRGHLERPPVSVTPVSKTGVFTFQENTILITESGLYSLILRSKLKTAKAFQRWVTKEVLPSIRKKGEYILEDYKKQLEEKQKQLDEQRTKVKTLENKYLHHLPRVKYPVTFVIYMITTQENKKNRTYIMGKTTNLTTRLSTYNKTCDHEVVYYKECISETVMVFAESMLFLRLSEYREKLSCERFILPADKEESFFISEIDTTLDFFKNVKADARCILREDQISPEKKKAENLSKKKAQKRTHQVNHSEIYRKYRKEYYLKNKTQINLKNKMYRYRNLQRVKNIEKTSRVKNKLKEQARKKLYRLKNKDKIQQYILINKQKLKENSRLNYLKNRSKKIEQAKTYAKTHKEERCNYLKKYREENKDTIKQKRAEKILCECGVEHTKSSQENHLSSKKHIAFLKSISGGSSDIIEALELKNEKTKKRGVPTDKDLAKSKRSEMVLCECGQQISKGGLVRHKTTKTHFNALNIT
jgi:prophage antirepressor-like protein